MSDIRHLDQREDVIRTLEALLEDAKKGDLAGFCYGGVIWDGRGVSGWAYRKGVLLDTLIGATQRAVIDLAHNTPALTATPQDG